MKILTAYLIGVTALLLAGCGSKENANERMIGQYLFNGRAVEITENGILRDAVSGPIWTLQITGKNTLNMHPHIAGIDKTITGVFDLQKTKLSIVPSMGTSMELIKANEAQYEAAKLAVQDRIIPYNLNIIASAAQRFFERSDAQSVTVAQLDGSAVMRKGAVATVSGIDFGAIELQRGGGTITVVTPGGKTYDQQY